MKNKINIYTTPEGKANIEVQFEGETFWLSLNQMASLFEKDKSVISRHLSNIYKEGELDKSATVAKNATVQNEAERQVKRNIEYYNLDAIISVGYRVNSKRGTQFRQWATQRLKEYLIEGFLINEKRLDQQNKTLQTLHDGIRIISRAIKTRASTNNIEWLIALVGIDKRITTHIGRHTFATTIALENGVGIERVSTILGTLQNCPNPEVCKSNIT